MQEIKLDIKRIYRNEESVTPAFCYDDCVATYAASQSIDFRLWYAGRLNIGFDASNSCLPIGKRVVSGINSESELLELLGISFSRRASVSEIPDILEAGKVLLLAIDGFYCPWDWRFNVIAGQGHMLFITGIEPSSGDYICVDPYYKKERAVLSRESVESGLINLTIPEYDGRVPTDGEALLCGFGDRRPKATERLTGLVNALRDGFEPLREFEHLDPDEPFTIEHCQDKLLLNVVCKEMAHDRVRYAAFLAYLYENTGKQQYADASKAFLALSERYDLFRLQMLRRVFSRRWDGLGEYLADRLSPVVDEEYRLIDGLAGNTASPLAAAAEKSGDIIPEYLALDKYLNCCAVGSIGSDAAMSEEGEYFLLEGFPSGTAEKDGNRFSLPTCCDGNPDNLRCEGQRIEIGQTCCELLLLGCSDYDRCVENVQLVYIDGAEQGTLSFDDWLPDCDRALPSETVLTAKKVTYYAEDDYDTDDIAALYCCKIAVDPRRRLCELVLPDCDNLHIFAITVNRSNG